MKEIDSLQYSQKESLFKEFEEYLYDDSTVFEIGQNNNHSNEHKKT